jgi:hypothetical protein
MYEILDRLVSHVHVILDKKQEGTGDGARRVKWALHAFWPQKSRLLCLSSQPGCPQTVCERLAK